MYRREPSLLNTAICRALRFLQKVHHYVVTPLLGPRCRFHPSCSEYCCQAVEKHGPWRGVRLAIHRLLRCSGQSTGGNDPVP